MGPFAPRGILCSTKCPESASYGPYLFQNAGDSRARAVKISNLPSSMHTARTKRPKGSTISKLSVAPTCPSPGPTTLNVAATAVTEEVSVRFSCRATRKAANAKIAIQAAKSPSTAILTPSDTVRLPMTKGVTALGCTILKTSWSTVRKITITLMTFIPPAVEPAQPPTNISSTRVSFAAVSHLSKSAVTKPVVVVTLTTVNAESRSAVSQEEV